MKTLTQFINESKIELKPIHLLNNDRTYCDKGFFNACISSIEEDWPAATQDGHEDEVVYMTNEHPDFNKYHDMYILSNNEIYGESTRGMGNSHCGWDKYKTNTKYQIWRMFRGYPITKEILIGNRYLFGE